MDQNCNLCPRKCNVDRDTQRGFCGTGMIPVVAKYDLHMWEEPSLSGYRGSGAVFFSGCNLRCVYCQNHKISRKTFGKAMNPERLSEVFLELEQRGAHNINLITPSHFVLLIAQTIELARRRGLSVPIVYNTSAYECTGTLQMLNGLVDIWLPDFKYADNRLAAKYSDAYDYFEVACSAISEMRRQARDDYFDDDGLMRRGMIIRHLVLPDCTDNSKQVLDWIAAHMPNSYVSIMAQYFPASSDLPAPLDRRVTTDEYNSVVKHFFEIGLQKGFTQDAESAIEDYVPDFKVFTNCS